MLHKKIEELNIEIETLKKENQRLLVENEDLKNLNTFIGEGLSLKILGEQKFKKVLVIVGSDKTRKTLPNYIKQLKEFISNTETSLLNTIKQSSNNS